METLEKNLILEEKSEKFITLPRINCTGIMNPILKQMAETYNGLPQQIAFGDRTRSYSKGSHSKHNKGGSGGGCYLTTACTKAMNLPDDCYELNVLRSFRDNILMSQPTGKKAVREYYDMAPEIVQAVEEQEDAQVIWRSVYRDIGQAVSLVLSNDFEGALKHYKKLSLDLKQRYLD